ncbi:hypothetical protein HDIA_0750 [Hartmannibacter diazotrophicus]|uniref:Uncharacterized protein n=1 Tax=Hartmannibacter diazotrophicus TaxID=1482074 RepID=A0A2C9D3C6_9HYPH|nr:hypothetical protein [Hartmannibacter diazotrophicus]SON54291.1 hypothetical protein HDIA_0750 [Hartmannibacter diazotrophicus]
MRTSFLTTLPKDIEIGRDFKGNQVFEKIRIPHRFEPGDHVRCGPYEIDDGEIRDREWMNAPGRAAYPHYSVWWTDKYGKWNGLWLAENDFELLHYVRREAEIVHTVIRPAQTQPQPRRAMKPIVPLTKRQKRRASGKMRGTGNGR